MGQQQLLLLVLATVIVGLATVAGIQAFDENRNQAAADALSQKAAELAADIKGIDEKPQQIGGIPDDFTTVNGGSNQAAAIADRLGIDNSGTGAKVPAADGSTGTAGCTVSTVKESQISIKCTGGDEYSDITFYGVYEQNGNPEVRVQGNDIS